MHCVRLVQHNQHSRLELDEDRTDAELGARHGRQQAQMVHRQPDRRERGARAQARRRLGRLQHHSDLERQRRQVRAGAPRDQQFPGGESERDQVGLGLVARPREQPVRALLQ